MKLNQEDSMPESSNIERIATSIDHKLKIVSIPYSTLDNVNSEDLNVIMNLKSQGYSIQYAIA